MHVVTPPNVQQKIQLLDQVASLDRDGEPGLTPTQRTKADFLAGSIYQVQRPDGPMTVMRTVQTSACERNCRYCAFRAGRSAMARVSFTPDELAHGFDCMQRAGVVKGLFLSSGVVGGGVRTMDPMLATADLLRHKHAYRGYLHLKIMPGAQSAQIEQAVQLADRVSVNLESVDAGRLASIAPDKDFEGELLSAVRQVNEIVNAREPGAKVPSMVTQFVVGAAGESDQELLTTVDRLYRRMNLDRAYYSGFNPVPDTPLEDAPSTPLVREHRLYQADWLLRFYGFALRELPFDLDGSLPSGTDPKLAWAHKSHLADRPVEVNRVSRSHLLRVPGIGARSADAILRARRQGTLRSLADLRALGAVTGRAAPFILLDGHRPPRQLSFWDSV